jgi:uncharacterized protein YqgV (UPF0045/DUF77 family)
MKVTFETKAWLSNHNHSTPADLLTPMGAAGLHYTPIDMSDSGSAFIANATVTIDIPDERTLVENKVEALREQAASIRAQATAKCTQIEGQIQNLLAITYDPVPESAEEA